MGCVQTVTRRLQRGSEQTEKRLSQTEVRWMLSVRGLRYVAASAGVPASFLLKPVQRSKPSVRDERTLKDGTRPDEASHHNSVKNQRNGGEQAFMSTRHATAEMWQPGTYMLHKHLRHTAGVYELLAAFVRASGMQPGHHVEWFESGVRGERSYIMGGRWYTFRPDAALEYRVGEPHTGVLQRYVLWLEWDEGTMAQRRLAEKMATYARYLRTATWKRSDGEGVLPRLLIVVPERGQFDRMTKAAQEELRGMGLQVFVTMQALLRQQGVLAAIWSRVHPPPADGYTKLQTFLDMP